MSAEKPVIDKPLEEFLDKLSVFFPSPAEDFEKLQAQINEAMGLPKTMIATKVDRAPPRVMTGITDGLYPVAPAPIEHVITFTDNSSIVLRDTGLGEIKVDNHPHVVLYCDKGPTSGPIVLQHVRCRANRFVGKYLFRHKGKKRKGRPNYPPLRRPLTMQELMRKTIGQERRWAKHLMSSISGVVELDPSTMHVYINELLRPLQEQEQYRLRTFDLALHDPTTPLGRAYEFAKKAHEGQVDKAGKPYIEHLVAVARRGQTLEEQITGMFHDLFDDTKVTPAQLYIEFPLDRVMRALLALNRNGTETRWQQIERIGEDELATNVKIYDLDHNLDPMRFSSPAAYDEYLTQNSGLREHYIKAKRYLVEKKLLRPVSDPARDYIERNFQCTFIEAPARPLPEN